jgi:hypothetical protein
MGGQHRAAHRRQYQLATPHIDPLTPSQLTVSAGGGSLMHRRSRAVLNFWSPERSQSAYASLEHTSSCELRPRRPLCNGAAIRIEGWPHPINQMVYDHIAF